MQPVKGMRDFLPEEKMLRDWIGEQIERAYKSYGFLPWETPALESFQTLARKGAGEGVKEEIYFFKDKGNRELGLRFDLTVPLARVIASNPQLPKPFKRYEIGPVWRYENPQAGRYRQFVQADADIVGVTGMEAEAECLAAAVQALKNLGFSGFTIKLNNRKILDQFAEDIGIADTTSFFRILDKAEKIGEKQVKALLKKEKLSEKQMKETVSLLQIKGKPQAVLKRVADSEGAEELKVLLELLQSYGISKWITLDLSLVRGLDYYTGTIFEITAQSKVIRSSIAGGGRYDNLIGLYGRATPAVGISLGFERIYELLKPEKQIIPKRVLVVAVNDAVRKQALKVAEQLRSKGIAVSTDLMGRDVRKQLDYANATAIPYAIIVGESELKTKTVVLKDMKSGKEQKKTVSQIENILSHT